MSISAHGVLKNKEDDMAVKIITDSVSDITQARYPRWGRGCIHRPFLKTFRLLRKRGAAAFFCKGAYAG